MKKVLNWQSKEVVEIIDEVTLWSAPFGRLLLENIPMISEATVVDIGFGTGFPLIELSQRFGKNSKIYGIDIWEEAINITKNKISILEIDNVQILEESASKINLDDSQIDLVTSNLGVNNFDEKDKVYSEIHRILKPGGNLCITTNPIETFEELFEIFESVLNEMMLNDGITNLRNSIAHRGTEKSIINEIENKGLRFIKSKFDSKAMRFVDAKALMDHSLIRFGFREYWGELVKNEMRNDFFEQVIFKIQSIIAKEGEFKITIPMLYLEFVRD